MHSPPGKFGRAQGGCREAVSVDRGHGEAAATCWPQPEASRASQGGSAELHRTDERGQPRGAREPRRASSRPGVSTHLLGSPRRLAEDSCPPSPVTWVPHLGGRRHPPSEKARLPSSDFHTRCRRRRWSWAHQSCASAPAGRAVVRGGHPPPQGLSHLEQEARRCRSSLESRLGEAAVPLSGAGVGDTLPPRADRPRLPQRLQPFPLSRDPVTSCGPHHCPPPRV